MKLKKKKSWADRRLASARVDKIGRSGFEYLAGCAIMRGGHVYGDHGHYRSHSAIRNDLGDKNIYDEQPGETCGYITSTGRFVGRVEASTIAVLARQAAPMYEGRKLLSSDITWRTP
jgi:hypothetical protein